MAFKSGKGSVHVNQYSLLENDLSTTKQNFTVPLLGIQSTEIHKLYNQNMVKDVYCRLCKTGITLNVATGIKL